ncbi:MAG: aminopeptidase P family protein [Proteobacteria bacterium]|nr:aminopeptidase P family protein [Pseudomonadota bacterium]
MDRNNHTDSAIRAGLEAAEARGNAMFDAIERAGIIRAGITEKDVDNEIYILAKKDFGVDVHWHKRLVRTGINTVCVYAEDPEPRMIASDDTVFLDLGPVFASANAKWEADLGRSYALGDDPEKKRLVADLPRLFEVVKAHYDATPDITGEELYAYAQKVAGDTGWIFGGTIAGHIVGEFPHAQRIPGREEHRIAKGNTRRMRDPDANGHERHWILEIHLVDKTKSWGGFYERLL